MSPQAKSYEKIICSLRKSNEELKKLNRLKSDSISYVSHELRVPLACIKEGVSQVLDGTRGETNEKQKQVLSIVSDNINQLGKLLNTFLDISKIESGKLTLKRSMVDMRSLVKNLADSFRIMAKKKNIHINCVVPEWQVNMFVDMDRVSEVILNLMSNAYKFTDKNGKIMVVLKDMGKYIELAVRDTGSGIAKVNMPKLFKRFTQFGQAGGSGEKGTGLGLAICSELINLHKGRIWAQSKLGKGSAFKFTIPKLDGEEIIKQSITNEIKEAIDREATLSIIVLKIQDHENVEKKLKGTSLKGLLSEMEEGVGGGSAKKNRLTFEKFERMRGTSLCDRQ